MIWDCSCWACAMTIANWCMHGANWLSETSVTATAGGCWTVDFDLAALVRLTPQATITQSAIVACFISFQTWFHAEIQLFQTWATALRLRLTVLKLFYFTRGSIMKWNKIILAELRPLAEFSCLSNVFASSWAEFTGARAGTFSLSPAVAPAGGA